MALRYTLPVPTSPNLTDRLSKFARFPVVVFVGKKVRSANSFIATKAVCYFARLSRSDGTHESYMPGTHQIRRALLRPTILGFIASTAIFLGASQPNSPFTLKTVPGAWWFGIPTPPVTGIAPTPGQGLFLGVVAVYAGILLMLRAWYDVVMLCLRIRDIPYRKLLPVFFAWVLPLLVVAPLFSRDAYSYIAQGELMVHHLNPYIYGPKVLGVSTQFTRLTDPLWQLVTSPYGPMFLTLAGWVVRLSGPSPLVAVEGMRAIALFGTLLFACSVPVIAKSFHRDGATAFALAALNPLILLHLVAGAHNDALMLGLLAFGYALHRRGYHVVGILFCAFAALVKVPAILGAAYIGWEWLGEDATPRERIKPLIKAGAISLVVMVSISESLGLGWGWISGLSNPDTVRSWLDPATGLALLLARIGTMIGVGTHTHVLLTICRGSALLFAGVLSVWLLWNAQRIGTLRALGLTLLAFVALSPVVQPWYAAWGFVMLAPIAERRMRRVLMICSGVACFLQLPGGSVLVNEITIANPIIVGLACAVLVALAGVLVSPRFRQRGHELGLTEDSASTDRDDQLV
jgi:hypothetical protein